MNSQEKKQNEYNKLRISMNKKRRLGIFVAAIVAITSIGLYALTSPTKSGLYAEMQGQNLTPQKELRIISASYLDYLNMKFLSGNSTFIGTGEVLGVKTVYNDPIVPTTDVEFRVDRVLKGDLKMGEIIIIRQTGAENTPENIVYEATDDPLLKQGEKIFAFMSYSQTEDVYVVLGGPQGRFDVQNGLVNSLDNRDPEAAWIPVKVKDLPLETFEQRVAAEAGQ
ncbi:MAG: hypothetical protein ACREBU_01195 [Nitrososphaera sp.]